MAFFSRKKDKLVVSEEVRKDKTTEADLSLESGAKTEKKNDATVKGKKTQVSNTLPTDRNLASVILGPRITEKAVNMIDSNVYTFNIRRDATKFDVRDAVKELFKVTPTRVNIVNKSPRQFMSRSRGRKVTEKGAKKAYVYLKEGDRIDLA